MTPIGKGRLFGGESPATGEDAQIAIVDVHMEVRTASHVHTPLLADLRLREVGAVQAGLEFAWESEAGIRAVQIFDAAALNTLRTNAAFLASPQMAGLKAERRRGAVGRGFGWTALALFLLLPILLLLVFLWQADRIARAVAEHVPIEQERKLGEQAFAAMRGTLSLQDSGPAYEAVQTLGLRLAQAGKYRYQFHVANDAAVNAFALPGGIIVVHTGLIASTRRPEELAGVLAHEVQHVEQRHSLQAMVKNLGLRGLWMLVTGDISSGAIGQAALELTSLSFSRDAEKQADAAGFDGLVAAGIDPRGMADFFAVMANLEGVATPPPFLSTHPASGDREATLRARENEIAGRTFEPLRLGDWPPPRAIN
ncbi:MAG TPA: M48 family metallopeptidase [Steroidobacter sp.]|uniref:M48 family metallopeptidase n=1 Tax=Steroidobacter sp. TaxID=1978227 RepID=UPI002ED9A690